MNPTFYLGCLRFGLCNSQLSLSSCHVLWSDTDIIHDLFICVLTCGPIEIFITQLLASWFIQTCSYGIFLHVVQCSYMICSNGFIHVIQCSDMIYKYLYMSTYLITHFHTCGRKFIHYVTIRVHTIDISLHMAQ